MLSLIGFKNTNIIIYKTFDIFHEVNQLNSNQHSWYYV